MVPLFAVVTRSRSGLEGLDCLDMFAVEIWATGPLPVALKRRLDRYSGYQSDGVEIWQWGAFKSGIPQNTLILEKKQHIRSRRHCTRQVEQLSMVKGALMDGSAGYLCSRLLVSTDWCCLGMARGKTCPAECPRLIDTQPLSNRLLLLP
jgi:hypothetical protein